MKRDVVRLVTPGTLTEDSLLDARRSNFLLAVARARTSSIAGEGYGLAWVDISTGEFRVAETDGGRLAADIARVDPPRDRPLRRALCDTTLADFWRSFRAVSPVPRDLFDGATAERRLAGYFASARSTGSAPSPPRAHRRGRRRHLCRAHADRDARAIDAARSRGGGAAMLIDAATRANLELVRTLGGERQGSLLAAIDRTVTAAGARLLAVRLASPLTDPAAIAARLDAVEALVAAPSLRAEIRARLAEAPDMARALTRIAMDRGGPRDLAAIGQGLVAAVSLATLLGDVAAGELGAAAQGLARPSPSLADRLAQALDDELPL